MLSEDNKKAAHFFLFVKSLFEKVTKNRTLLHFVVSSSLNLMTLDYRESADFIDENTFVYFDPPYLPITDTASFTAYTENLFNDEEQIVLARFVDDMHRTGAKVMISDNQRLMSERTKYSVIVKEVFYDENVIEAVSNEEAMSLAIHEYEMQSHNKCRKASEISISIRSNFSHIIAEKTADTNEWEIL